MKVRAVKVAYGVWVSTIASLINTIRRGWSSLHVYLDRRDLLTSSRQMRGVAMTTMELCVLVESVRCLPRSSATVMHPARTSADVVKLTAEFDFYCQYRTVIVTILSHVNLRHFHTETENTSTTTISAAVTSLRNNVTLRPILPVCLLPAERLETNENAVCVVGGTHDRNSETKMVVLSWPSEFT